jgi:hypothetical protein
MRKCAISHVQHTRLLCPDRLSHGPWFDLEVEMIDNDDPSELQCPAHVDGCLFRFVSVLVCFIASCHSAHDPRAATVKDVRKHIEKNADCPGRDRFDKLAELEAERAKPAYKEPDRREQRVRALQIELGEVSPKPTGAAKPKKGKGKGKQRAVRPSSSSTRTMSAAGQKRGRDSDDSGPSDSELRPSASKSARPSARRVVVSSDSDSDDAPEPKTPPSAAVDPDDKPEPRVFGNKIDDLHDTDTMRFVFDNITADDFVNDKTERLVSFLLVLQA